MASGGRAGAEEDQETLRKLIVRLGNVQEGKQVGTLVQTLEDALLLTYAPHGQWRRPAGRPACFALALRTEPRTSPLTGLTARPARLTPTHFIPLDLSFSPPCLTPQLIPLSSSHFPHPSHCTPPLTPLTSTLSLQFSHLTPIHLTPHLNPLTSSHFIPLASLLSPHPFTRLSHLTPLILPLSPQPSPYLLTSTL